MHAGSMLVVSSLSCLFCAYENFGDETVEGELEFYVDNILTDIMSLTLAPHKRYAKLFENLNYSTENTGENVKFKLQLNIENDFLECDNIVYGILPEIKPLKILLVSDGNYSLATNYDLIFEQEGENGSGSIFEVQYTCQNQLFA